MRKEPFMFSDTLPFDGASGLASNSSDGYQSEETTLDRMLRQFKSGLFGVLYIMSKETHVSTVFAIVMMFMHFVQMIQFPLNHAEKFPWQSVASMAELTDIIDVISLNDLASRMSTRLSIVAFYLCLIWIAAVVVAAIWCGYSFSQKHFRVLWPLKFLRFGAQITTTVMFIPMMHVLIGIFSCHGETWGGTNWKCWGSTHMAFMVLVLSVLPLFTGLSFIVVATFFDRDPSSKNIEAKSHGRVAVAMLGVKVVLTLMFTLVDAVNVVILAIASLIGGFIWFSLHVYFVPFHNTRVNCIEASMGLVMAWASACLLIALKVTHQENAAFAFWCAVPFVAFVGYYAVHIRLATVRKATEFTSPLLVEMKVRLTISEQGDTPEVLTAVDKIFEAALTLFSTSSLIHIAFAHYLQKYKKNRPMEMAQLALAERKEPALDEYFLIYQRRRQVEETESTTGSSKMNVITRVAFEKHMAESRLHSNQAREKQVLFWNELLEKEPDIGRLHQVGVDLNESITKAENSFGQLLRINPQSVTVLRAYAQFLLEVVNHDSKANQLLDEADRIEDSESKRHQLAAVNVVFSQESDPLDGSSENVGLITMSAKPEALGQINSLNTTALKMFGYTNRDVVGKNISTLIPEPFASVHNKFLEMYLQSGKEFMLNSTRIVFGLHSGGTIFPMHMGVKAMQPGFGALVLPISTEDGFIIFMKTTGSITACCAESLSVFGLPASALTNEAITVSRWVPNFAELAESPMAGAIAAQVDLINVSKDRSASGTLQVSAKFQVITVPVLTDKVVLMKWHALSSKSSKHDSVDRKHDSFGVKRVSHGQMLPAAHGSHGDSDRVGCVFARAQQHTSEPEESRDHKPRLRFDMQAERRYSVTAKPLYHPSVDAQPSSEGIIVKRCHAEQSGASLREAEGTGGMERDWSQPSQRVVSTSELTATRPARLLIAGSAPLTHTQSSSESIQTVDNAQFSGLRDSLQLIPSKHRRSASSRIHPLEVELPLDALNVLDSVLSESQHSKASNSSPMSVSGEPSNDAQHNESGMTSGGCDSNDAAMDEDTDDTRELLKPSPLPRFTRVNSLKQRRRLSKVGMAEGSVCPLELVPSNVKQLHGGNSIHNADEDQHTVGSSTSQDTALHALRKSMERKQQQLDPGLNQLRRCFAWIFLFTGAVNIIVMVVMRAMLSDYLGLLSDMKDAGQRQVLAQQVITDVQRLVLMRDGWVDPLRENATRLHMKDALLELESVHDRLYLTSQSTEFPLQAALYADRTIMVSEFGTGKTVLRGLNLVEVGVEFVQQSRAVLNLPLRKITPTQASVKYVLHNGMYAAQHALNVSSGLILDQANNHFNTMSKVQGMVLMAVIMLFDLILIAAVVPIVRKIESSKDKILKIFLDVPIVVVRYLKQRCQDRLDMLTETEDEDGVPKENETVYEDEKRDWSTTNFKVKRRVFRKSLKLYFYLLLKFAGPSFGIILYLATLYMWDSLVMQSIQFTKNEVYYAQQRRVLTNMFDFHVRDLVTASDSMPLKDFFAVSNITHDLDQQILNVEDGLLFGNYYWDLPGSLSREADQSELLLKNGCVGSPTMDACAAYAHGIMNNGLHGALLEFQRRGRTTLDSVFRDRLHGTLDTNVTTQEEVIDFLDVMTSSYLSDGLTRSADTLESGTKATLSVYSAWLVALTVSSLLGMFLFYTMSYRPAILQMDKDMRRTRAMLLVFPDEVINGVERIRNLLREVTLQMQQ